MRHFDSLENCDPSHRHANLFSRLPDVLRHAMQAPAYAEHLKDIDPAAITSPAALAGLPVLRKSDLPALQKVRPPFGGFVAGQPGTFGRDSHSGQAHPRPPAGRAESAGKEIQQNDPQQRRTGSLTIVFPERKAVYNSMI